MQRNWKQTREMQMKFILHLKLEISILFYHGLAWFWPSKAHATGTYMCANTDHQVLLHLWAGQAEPAGPRGLSFVGKGNQG